VTVLTLLGQYSGLLISNAHSTIQLQGLSTVEKALDLTAKTAQCTWLCITGKRRECRIPEYFVRSACIGCHTPLSELLAVSLGLKQRRLFAVYIIGCTSLLNCVCG
jgi:hypothetical protein